jgi:hypothetical protein
MYELQRNSIYLDWIRKSGSSTYVGELQVVSTDIY